MGCSVGLKYAKMLWRPELGHGPRCGSSRRSPDPLVGWGGEHPTPFPTPSAPLAPRFSPLRRFDPRAPRGSLVSPATLELATVLVGAQVF